MLATYGRQIQGVAYLIVHSSADAEEILVDTLLTAWQQIHRLRDAERLRSWLLRIAARKALTRLRSSRGIDRLLPIAGASDNTASIPDRLSIAAGVSHLPPRMRVAIALRYYADLSIAEMAEILDRSPNTVKTELRLALTRLRDELREPDLPTEASDDR
jgi:RNA polymerase sigma-70 factor (ECF subfamily)